MTRILASLVLGATMFLTTAVAFAENNSAMDRLASRNRVEQPGAIKLDTALVSGAPSHSIRPWHEQRLDNLDPHR